MPIMTTKVLIEAAFGIRDFQVSGGPAWLDNDNYDIVAKTATPVALTEKALEPYLQSLLDDRFHLKYHRDTKELPVYLLVPSKNGPKLTPHTGDDGESENSSGTNEKVNMSGTNLSMTGLPLSLTANCNVPLSARPD
jgi:uncharacterized protein (TIGR03435 family)